MARGRRGGTSCRNLASKTEHKGQTQTADTKASPLSQSIQFMMDIVASPSGPPSVINTEAAPLAPPL